MAPGSQTFEQCFFKMIRDGSISQEEAMANADSPSNLIWLLNNTEVGATTPGGAGTAKQEEKKREDAASQDGGASFTEITLITEDSH
jgi:twitching motility protein PilU